MIRHECPGITCRLRFWKKGRETIYEIPSIRGRTEDIPPLDSSYHHMMKNTGSVEAGSSSHVSECTSHRWSCQLKY